MTTAHKARNCPCGRTHRIRTLPTVEPARPVVAAPHLTVGRHLNHSGPGDATNYAAAKDDKGGDQ